MGSSSDVRIYSDVLTPMPAPSPSETSRRSPRIARDRRSEDIANPPPASWRPTHRINLRRNWARSSAATAADRSRRELPDDDGPCRDGPIAPLTFVSIRGQYDTGLRAGRSGVFARPLPLSLGRSEPDQTGCHHGWPSAGVPGTPLSRPGRGQSPLAMHLPGTRAGRPTRPRIRVVRGRTAPSHLISLENWLTTDLIRSGLGRRKHQLRKSIVTNSATYRQSSRTSPTLRHQSAVTWRQSPVVHGRTALLRLSAEIPRNQVLAASAFSSSGLAALRKP